MQLTGLLAESPEWGAIVAGMERMLGCVSMYELLKLVATGCSKLRRGFAIG